MKVYLQPDMFNPYFKNTGFTFIDFQVIQYGITLVNGDLKFCKPFPNKTLSVLQVSPNRKALSGFLLDFTKVAKDLLSMGQFTTSMRCLFGKKENEKGEVSGRIITVNITYKIPNSANESTVLIDRKYGSALKLAGFAGFKETCKKELLEDKDVLFDDDGFVKIINIECNLISQPNLETAFSFSYNNRHPDESHCFTIPYFDPIHIDLDMEEDNPNISEFMYRTGADLRRYEDGTADLHIDDGFFSKTLSPRLNLKELELWSKTAHTTQ